MAATIIEKKDLHTPNNGPVKGRRKLDFSESQRFKGKHFFLDLDGYRKANQIAAELTNRGATIEKFLDKRVRYLITNKPQKAIDHAKAGVSSNPTTPSTGGLSQVFSPYSTGQSPHLDKKISPQPYYYTRSRKMLEMAKEKSSQSAKADVLAIAARWKCKILHVGAVEKELKKLKPLTTKKMIEYKRPTPKYIKKLRKPFLKVEDKSYQYRPIVYEPTKWPSLNLNCLAKVSPFDSKPHKDALDNESRAHNSNEREEVEEEDTSENGNDEVCEDEKRPGFCEPCSMRYEDLKCHLLSVTHQKYADDERNFAKLDELISQCTLLSDFLAEVRKSSRLSKTPDRCVASPVGRSPMVKEAHLSLKRIASPIVPLLTTACTRRAEEPCSGFSDDPTAKRTRLNL